MSDLVKEQSGIWDEDKLGRKELAEPFTTLLKSINQPYVIALDSPFGTGKSFFIDGWSKHLTLNEDHFISLVFNAWEYDFFEHPFVPFVAEILNKLKTMELGKDACIEKVQQVGNAIFNTLLEEVRLKQVADAITDDPLEKYDHFKAFNKYCELIQDFKKHLGSLVHSEQKLVIFIDELERCRPTFAVELLECIKHLFNQKHIIFVLATDRVQLGHTVNKLYGHGYDAPGYLRRFFDLDLRLPEAEPRKLITHLMKQFGMYDENFFYNDEAMDPLLYGRDSFIQYFNLLSQGMNLTLREISYCMSHLNTALRLIGNNKVQIPIMLSLMIILRVKSERLYKLITNKFFLTSNSPAQRIEEIKQFCFDHYRGDKEEENVKTVLTFCLIPWSNTNTINLTDWGLNENQQALFRKFTHSVSISSIVKQHKNIAQYLKQYIECIPLEGSEDP